MACGIYRIVCKPTGQIYIGSSIDVQLRFNGHRRTLERGRGARRFQEAWNKHGQDAFVFEVVELCERIKLAEREFYFIRQFKALGPGGLNESRSRRGSDVRGMPAGWFRLQRLGHLANDGVTRRHLMENL